MSSEVEKLYSLIGVEPINIAYYGSTSMPDSIVIDGKFYPSFTAEKQLGLIKWLMGKSFSYSTVEDKDGIKYWFEIDYETSSHGYKNFEETIADTINEMWQDLTEEEQNEIRRILG